MSYLDMNPEKAMAPHSSTLAWKIPWTEEPGRLQSKGSRRVGHDWATSLSLFAFMHWRRKWQPTPVFLPGESQGREPGGLPSMVLHGVGHDWSDLAAAILHCIYVPHLLYPFICWWTLRLLHVLATVNSAAMNIRMHEFFWMRDISEYTSRCGIVGSYIVLWGTSILFSIGAAPIYIPTNSVGGFPSLHTLSSIYYCRTFDDGHSDLYEVVHHCSFGCISIIISMLRTCQSRTVEYILFNKLIVWSINLNI